MTSPFKGITNHTAARDSEYMRAGRYLVHLNAFKTGSNRQNIPNFVFETTVVAVLDDTNCVRDPKGPHAIGHKASWVLSTKMDSCFPNLKGALMAATGVQEEAITEEFCEQLTGSAQPLRGMYFEFDNDVVSGEKGLFTVVKLRRRWSKSEVLEVVSEEQLKKLSLSLDGADD